MDLLSPRVLTPNLPLEPQRRDGGDLNLPGRVQISIVTGEIVEWRNEQVDAIVLELARRQRQVVARRQLFAAGMTRGAIEHRVRTAALMPIHRGAYAVGHGQLLPLAREVAALLACGPDAALGNATAAAVWRMLETLPDVVDVWVVGRRPAPARHLRVHRTNGLQAIDVVVRNGLRVTSPARTLLDLAADVDDRALRWALEEARLLRLVRARDIELLLARNPRKRGAARLRRILAAGGGPVLTRSEAERLLLDLIRAARLPLPETNVRVGGFEVDACWRAQRVIAEVDGFQFHGSRAAFERDRRRDAALQAGGWRVVRLTWRRLTEEPEVVVALLAGLLATSPAPGT